MNSITDATPKEPCTAAGIQKKTPYLQSNLTHLDNIHTGITRRNVA